MNREIQDRDPAKSRTKDNLLMHAIEQESRRQDDAYDVRDDRERIRSHKPNFSILRYKEKRVIPNSSAA